MNLAEIQSRVAKVIEEQLNVTGVGLADELADFGADELDYVETVMKLEDEFDIEIHDDNPMFYEDAESVHKLKNVETISKEIQKLIEAGGERVEPLPEEKVQEKQADWYEESWDKLREHGLFRFINLFLHIFGWAIQMEMDDDGKIERVYPIRCKYDGFSEGDEKMMRKIGTFMKCDEWLRNLNDKRFSENS
jgi:acyl carrier protein